ncbi:phage tail tape measure protein [Hymenobacter sp. H14-R3]|uniref:phage tail tape measure protein n=1 Tax=Hymenobacter sp. H14-R3 TaxID=3046308 RepID=UPI0024B92B2A|nr:phage tail tape measure protein [Hymenobacter sp. H14-R3]MDJ0363570.1 phage tail tape measure protein [Hymenobacter sp. H14-R3]
MRNYQWVINLIDKASGPMKTILASGDKMAGMYEKVKAGAKAAAVGMAIANQAAQGIQTAATAFNNAVEPGIRYEQTLAEVSAITGVAGAGLDKMGASARAAANTFGGSVVPQLEAAKGILSELGPQMAKDQAAMDSTTASVNILAKSMGGDTVGAMKALTTGVQQFGVDTNNTQLVAKAMSYEMNVMAAAANAGAAEVPQIAEALRLSGIAAAGAKVSFVETNAAIQVLAQGGLKGAEAGTALRNVLAKLGEGRFMPKDLRAELKAAGVDINVMGNKSLTLNQRLTELKKVQGDSALVSKIFGLENQNAANILLRGTGAMANYATAISGTNAATDAANTIMDTTAGRMDRMKALWENLGISVFNATKEYIPYIQTSAQVAVMASQMLPLLSMMGSGFLVAAGATWKFVLSQTASGLSMLKNVGLMVSTGILGLISFSGSLVGATVAQWALNAAMSANPIGLVIAGLAILAGAVYLIIRNWDVLKGWMWNLTQTIVKLSPFYWLVKGAFALFPQLEQWFQGLWARFTGFLQNLVGKVKAVWNLIAPFLGLGKMGDIAIDAKVIQAGKNEDPFAAGTKSQGLAANQPIKSKVDGVAKGGSKPTTINIAIAKFQDSINIHTTTLKEGANDMVAQLEEALTRVVNGVSQGTGNL